ncbi:PKD domain-containing protein [Aestuariibaculum lutulentum]|uniref:Ig-like domain-containing protein n=1 Tax=Aestuariibaculum lutulentum TaxID=2920935 RepID=A0ABS9RDN8_9FLAO|nr:hypothetical protein [Aestuariibaculum lutulentum]MCH4551055.1 hypothetical protein [Aestuariibaculum lutulentum]
MKILKVLLFIVVFSSCTNNEDTFEGINTFEGITNDSLVNGNDHLNNENDHLNNNETSTDFVEIKIGAGTDKLVFLPNNSCRLNGWASYQVVNPPVKYRWDKIAGPDSFHFVSPDSLSTILNELEKGMYKIEITCIAANGYIAKDTCSVIVGQFPSPSNFIVFNNQKWDGTGLLWGAQILIPDIYQYIPIGGVFKVFLRRLNSETWEEIMFDDHDSLISAHLFNGNLGIYSNVEETDSPDIKIEY